MKKKNKQKNRGSSKINRKFNLFKNIFVTKENNNFFYNLKKYIYGVSYFKLYTLLFLSNSFIYLPIYKLNRLNIVGIRFCLSSLFLCLKKELYKKNLLLKRYKRKK